MAEDARLQIVLRLKDEASAKMKNIDKSFKQSAGRIAKSAGAGALVAGAAFAATGKTMQSFGDETKTAENAIKMGTGAMGDDLDALMDSTRAVSGQVPQDFVAVANAVADVNTEFGLVGKPLEETTKMFLDVARVAKTEAGPMVKGVSDIMQVFGVDSAEANRILGDFIKVAQDTGQPLSKVISDMVTYGPVLKIAGMRTDDAAGFLGAFADMGVDASRVMPALNKRISDLADEGVPDLGAALMNDIEALSNMTDEVYQANRATDIFGTDGSKRLLAAINAGLIPASEEFTEKLRITTDEVNNLTTDTLTTSDHFNIMKNRLLELIRPFSETIAMVGAILIPLGLLALALGGLSLAAGVLGTTLLPLLAIILAVIAAVTIGVLIFQNWDKIMEFLGKTWDKVWKGIRSVFDFVWGLLDSKLGKLIALFIPGGALLVGLKLVSENWDAIWNGMKTVLKAVATPIVGFINAIIGAFNALFDVMRPIEFGWDAKKVFGKTVLPAFKFSPFGFLPTIPEIPSFAQGGIVRSPTIAQIGEAGPEAIVPLRAGAGLGTNITINFPQGSTVILDNEASARSLADQITQQIRGVLRAQGAF
tara:strand:- start:2571 stop:4349 length:1779 start_codon:yes stop_codon:yes gene_type:complete